jgi:hypothetical protein
VKEINVTNKAVHSSSVMLNSLHGLVFQDWSFGVFFNDEVNCQAYKASVTDERSTGRMTLTRENQSALRKTCPIASLSTTGSPLIALNPNPGLGGEKQVTN